MHGPLSPGLSRDCRSQLSRTNPEHPLRLPLESGALP